MVQPNLTRKKALEEGRQKDVTDKAKQSGLLLPVFITDAVWSNWITPDQKTRESGQDEKQRFDYLISKLVYSLRVHRQTSRSDTIYFNISFTKDGGSQDVMLMSKVGVIDSDDPRPCITIMMADEYSDPDREGATSN